MVRNAIITVVIIILVVVAAVWLLLPQIQSTGAQLVIGKVTIPVIVLIALWKLVKWVFPEGVKLFVASLLRKIGYLPLGLKRVVVRNEVEGNLNTVVKEFGREGSRLLPHPASLVWVSPGELSPDSFFRDGRIIIRLDYSENPHRNIVEGALLYCRAGLVPETRRYLWNEFRQALDLAFVNAVLERNDLREGLLYFAQEVTERELQTNPGVQKEYNTLYELHEHGYFTRILLPELRDYAGRVHTADTRTQHQQWITNFVDFLMEMTREHPHGTKWALDHIRTRFRTSIIIVGDPYKLAFQGQRLYLKTIAKCATNGARTIFLIGTSGAIPDITKNATKLKIVDASECGSYHVSRHDKTQRFWCARLEVSEQTAASALERVPGIKDWPDFKVEAKTDKVEAD